MHWQYSPYTLPLLLVGAVTAALALYAWLRRTTPGASAFALNIAALAEWSIGAGLQHAGADLYTQNLWNKVQYVGIVLCSVSWFYLCLQYTGRVRRLSWRGLLLLAVPCLFTTVLVWSNDAHHLFWTQLTVDTSRPYAVLVTRFGPLFWLHLSYCYLFLLGGSLLLFQALFRAPLVYRGQAWALLVAVVVPWVANVAYIAGYRPFPNLDLTPFAFSISAFAFGWGLFRFGLLDLVPVAHERVIEGMSDGLVVLDSQQRFVDLNPAARRILGPRASEAVGRSVEAVLGDQPELVQAFHAAPGSAPEVALAQGDAVRTFEIVSSLLSDRPGRSAGRLVMLRDVTERRHAEDALRRQNRYLAALLESSRVINSGLAIPTVLRNIAEEAARLIGADPGGVGLVRGGGVVFEHVWVVDHWESPNLVFPVGVGIAGLAASTGQALIVNDARNDPRLEAPEELEKCGAIGLMAVPILDRAGAVVGVLDIHRRIGGVEFTDADVHVIESLARQAAIAIENAGLYGALEEKKQRIAESLWAIEELYQNEQKMRRRLQELDLMKTNFMIVTSHEMRTPLTLLRGYLDTLVEGFLGVTNTAQAEALGVCKRTVDRMIASFNDILEMMQLGERRVALNRRVMDLAAAAREVLADMAPFLDRRRQRATLEVADGLPAVTADPDRLRLVLANLVENAMKFTPDAGEIRLSIRPSGPYVHITVEDNGIGIEPAELERIFDEFYTSPDSLHHSSGSGQFGFEARGAGLGLAIARGHVEAHGGRVWAESDGRGRGSRFHVLLPWAPPEEAVAS